MVHIIVSIDTSLASNSNSTGSAELVYMEYIIALFLLQTGVAKSRILVLSFMRLRQAIMFFNVLQPSHLLQT